MTSKEIASVRITVEGDTELYISKIEDGVAYDQNNIPISKRAFRFNPSILDNNWVRPKELIVR